MRYYILERFDFLQTYTATKVYRISGSKYIICTDRRVDATELSPEEFQMYLMSGDLKKIKDREGSTEDLF